MMDRRDSISAEDLPPGACARVLEIRGEESFRRRLYDLGFLPQTEICLVRRAPLGGPVEIKIRGYHLALRREDARKILLQL